MFTFCYYIYCDSWKSDNFEESNQEAKKIDTFNKAKKIKSDNFTRRNREKSNISIKILKINNGRHHIYFGILVVPIIFLPTVDNETLNK